MQRRRAALDGRDLSPVSQDPLELAEAVPISPLAGTSNPPPSARKRLTRWASSSLCTRSARGAGGVQRQVALLDGAQIDRADAVLHLHQFQRTLVVAHRRVEHDRAVAQRVLGRQRAFDLAERALSRLARRRPPPASVRRCGSPPGRAVRRLGTAAPPGWRRSPTPGCRVPAARTGRCDAAAAGRQADARQLRGAGLAGAVECGRHAALGSNHVGTALQQLRRQADRQRRRSGGERRCHRDLGRRVAAEQQFERTQRLLARELGLAQHVAKAADMGARFGHRLSRCRCRCAGGPAPRDAAPRRSAGCRARSPRCSSASMARNQLLATVAAIDWRA